MTTLSRVVLAIDIGGTKTTAALVRGGEVLDHATAPTPAQAGPSAILATATTLGKGLAGPTPTLVGVASAGVVDRATGRITHATDALRDWAGTDVAGPLSEAYGVPAHVLNDVHAHGLGEARWGVGREASSLLLVAIGTGIGGVHVVDGVPLAGRRGAAGHVGHVSVQTDDAELEGLLCSCGRRGHLEGLAAGPSIVRLAARLGIEAADGRELAQLAASGSSAAVEAYQIAGRATGRALGDLMNVLDPEVVALTGGVVGASEHWEAALREGIADSAMGVVAQTPVLPAAAGVQAALLGAASWALDREAVA